jgi:hypothetical protein
MSQTNYVRIPPDSTGKQIRSRSLLDIQVTNVDTNTLPTILVGTSIVGATSGASGIFTGFDIGVEGSFIYLTNVVGTFQVGEVLNGGLATVDRFSDIYTQEVSLVDGNEPGHRLSIDERGSANVRFSGGEPGFDAFGGLQISQASVMDSHIYLYSDNPNKYIDVPLNGGFITHSSTASSLIFQTTTAVNSFIRRRSRILYPYEPGVGNQLVVSLAMGDAGKENVVRRWGLGTPENAVFFELNGITLNTVVRSSATGTVTETRYSRSTWNGDRLDNEATSAYLLDITKFNLYWIDYQWLGVGRIRFGAYAPNGTRILLQQVENANKHILPWAQTGTFPLLFEQFNIGIPASSSEMKVACAVMLRQNRTSNFSGEQYGFAMPVAKQVTDVPTHLFTARFNETVNGRPNYIGVLPTILDTLVTDEACIMELWINAPLTSPAPTFDFQPHPNTAINLDFGNSDVTTAPIPFRTILLDTGFNRFEPDQTNINNMLFGIPEAPGLSITWTARTLKAATTANVMCSFEYKEIR